MKKDLLPRWPSLLPPEKAIETSKDVLSAQVATLAHERLEESIMMLKTHPQLHPFQQEELEGVIVQDALQLVSRLVPSQVAQELSLEIPVDDSLESELPTTSDIYLLADVIDTTHNPTIYDALEYMLEHELPTHGTILKQAFDKAKISGDPIMLEERRAGIPEDVRLDPLIQDWVNSQFEKNSSN